jgi:hypothetical protein
MARKTLQQRGIKTKRKAILYQDKNRIAPIMDALIGVEDPDDIMTEILEVLKDVEQIPNVGNYYTFIYKPKTENIQYDEFPLVAVTQVFQWGFKGINFHWESSRSYTWNDLVGNLYVVRPEELEDLRTLSYGKIKFS